MLPPRRDIASGGIEVKEPQTEFALVSLGAFAVLTAVLMLTTAVGPVLNKDIEDRAWPAVPEVFDGGSSDEWSSSEPPEGAPDKPPDTYEMQLVYDGDAFYDNGSGNGTLDVIAEVSGVTYTGDTSGAYGGIATFSCYLEDADNATAIAGAEVNFTLNGVTYTATTNSTGHANMTITVTAPPGTYQVVVNYKMSESPKVFVTEPQLERPPHLYDDGSLCLYYPKDVGKRWERNSKIAETIIPWTALWLHYYELYLETGEWLGPEAPHEKQ